MLGFDPVFDKEVVACSSVAHILFYQQVVNGVDGDYSCKRVVNSIAPHKGSWHFSVHMEVDTVPPKDPGLAAMEELSVGDVSLGAIA